MKKITTLFTALGLFATTAFAQQTELVVQEAQPQVTQTITQPVTVAQPQTVQQVVTPSLNPNQLNINLASAAEIQDKLIGIGAKKAQAIVDYRTKNGAFSSIEQLKEVSGIGNATLEKNRDRIVLQ